MPQFASKWNLVKNYKNITTGLFVFSLGLFKKVVIADSFAIWATNGFNNAETLNMIEAWATSLSYTFQLYFDFSGYTDMAIGAALLFNVRLPQNFNSPYKAKDIQDFWRRWHITLSRFLKDYIYIPLGGNRASSFKVYSNLMTTFILGGIWHGAGWTFVFWGFLHGMALIVHKLWKNLNFTMNYILAWFITFNFINIAWVFFRAKEFGDAIKILGAMVGGELVLPEKYEEKLNFLTNVSFREVYFHLESKGELTIWLICAFIVTLAMKNSSYYTTNFKATKLFGFLFLVFFVSAILNLTKVSEFLYFNF